MSRRPNLIIDTPGVGHPIETIYAWIGGTTDQGIMAMNGLPLVASSRLILEMFKNDIQEASAAAGKTITLCQFTARIDLTVIKP